MICGCQTNWQKKKRREKLRRRFSCLNANKSISFAIGFVFCLVKTIRWQRRHQWLSWMVLGAYDITFNRQFSDASKNPSSVCLQFCGLFVDFVEPSAAGRNRLVLLAIHPIIGVMQAQHRAARKMMRKFWLLHMREEMDAMAMTSEDPRHYLADIQICFFFVCNHHHQQWQKRLQSRKIINIVPAKMDSKTIRNGDE